MNHSLGLHTREQQQQHNSSCSSSSCSETAAIEGTGVALGTLLQPLQSNHQSLPQLLQASMREQDLGESNHPDLAARQMAPSLDRRALEGCVLLLCCNDTNGNECIGNV
jgi:hypothetical protein